MDLGCSFERLAGAVDSGPGAPAAALASGFVDGPVLLLTWGSDDDEKNGSCFAGAPIPLLACLADDDGEDADGGGAADALACGLGDGPCLLWTGAAFDEGVFLDAADAPACGFDRASSLRPARGPPPADRSSAFSPCRCLGPVPSRPLF
ncbi:hypothetical protein V2A60_006654 [Cordyceps javanica]